MYNVLPLLCLACTYPCIKFWKHSQQVNTFPSRVCYHKDAGTRTTLVQESSYKHLHTNYCCSPRAPAPLDIALLLDLVNPSLNMWMVTCSYHDKKNVLPSLGSECFKGWTQLYVSVMQIKSFYFIHDKHWNIKHVFPYLELVHLTLETTCGIIFLQYEPRVSASIQGLRHIS